MKNIQSIVGPLTHRNSCFDNHVFINYCNDLANRKKYVTVYRDNFLLCFIGYIIEIINNFVIIKKNNLERYKSKCPKGAMSIGLIIN